MLAYIPTYKIITNLGSVHSAYKYSTLLAYCCIYDPITSFTQNNHMICRYWIMEMAIKNRCLMTLTGLSTLNQSAKPEYFWTNFQIESIQLLY
jgi:hypothetical protein